METAKTITILGINGHLGHAVAKAAVEAGWRVIGFGRSNRRPVAGVEFMKGTADTATDLQAATRDAAVVLHALNLPYDQWGNGRAEALTERVLQACEQKTVLFPGNIYNYRATDTRITPELRQDPETGRGRIRVALEKQLRAFAEQGKGQVLILRAGNFYGSDLPGDWFGQLILRDAKKHLVTLNPAHQVKNAWAYLPDLAQAFIALAEQRDHLSTHENFHFKGHLVTADDTFDALQKAVPFRLARNRYPWLMLTLLGVFMPIIRGLVQMRYLWEHELGLYDRRLEALLGQGFGTSFDAAMARVAAQHFGTLR